MIAELIKKNISREALVGNVGMHSEKNVGYADLRTEKFTGNTCLCSLLETYSLEEILEGAQQIIAAETQQFVDYLTKKPTATYLLSKH